MTNTTLAKATRNFQRAAASGDIDAAIHWMDILLAHMRAIRARALPTPAPSRPTPRPRRLKPKPAPQTTTPSMPVMLNPDGYSPGGTPNWFLNHQRLERAGLPRSLAPPTQAELRRQKDAAP